MGFCRFGALGCHLFNQPEKHFLRIFKPVSFSFLGFHKPPEKVNYNLYQEQGSNYNEQRIPDNVFLEKIRRSRKNKSKVFLQKLS